MNKASKNVFTRFLSAMLAVIMVFGLLPANQFVARAEAATGGEPSDTITPSGSIEMEGQYDSGYGLGRPYVHRFAMETGPAGVIDAFCLNHSDHLGHACEGKKWGNKRPYDPGKATPFVVWYYYHVHIAKDWDSSTTNVVNAWVQAIVWLAKAGKLSGSDDQIAEIGGTERHNVVKGIWGQASADANPPENGKTLLLQIMDSYKQGKYGQWKFYQYDFTDTNPYSSGNVQNLMIGVPEPPDDTGDKFYLTLDKHDPEGNPMAGKTFRIYTDSECKTPLPKAPPITTVAENGHAYGAFDFPDGINADTGMDIWVREEGAGATAEAATPHQLHVTKANDVNHPATVPGSPFQNETTTSTTPSTGTTPTTYGDDDLITMLDARTKLAVGGATFLIRSIIHI